MSGSLRNDLSATIAFVAPTLIVSLNFLNPSFAHCQIGFTSQIGPGNRSPAVPYTAEFKTTMVRTLPNGTTIHRETKSVQARDSQWRTYNQSETELAGNNNPSANTMGSINDPVSGSDTTWQSRTHEAITVTYPPTDQRHGCWEDDAGRRRMAYDPLPKPVNPVSAISPQPPQQPQIEDLGRTMMQGVEVQGRRITRTIPAGTVGNDQPIVVTNEIWSAPSLNGLTLKSINDDPRGGKTTREIVRLDLGEPDSSIFQPPSGYQVKIEVLHQTSCEKFSQ